MLTFMPELASKLAVVHHGVTEGFAPVVDEVRLAEARQRLGLPERFLLYVGQVYPHKNVAGILKALALPPAGSRTSWSSPAGRASTRRATWA